MEQKEQHNEGENNNATTPLEMPMRFGDYEAIKPIGKGKFAVVYRAQRISDGLIVALKRISVDQIDEKAREKCLKEVRLLQSLDHPNIIRYLDSFISENDLVIVVEWAAAGDLKRQLRKAQERGVGFEERIIWKYFSQISDAMGHMHERRIMHRDLKPANIFLTLDGTVKVGDLGLSRELSENTVQAHSKVGTPLYMSPEVLRGGGYDFKSDIWSLGCLLYELVMLKSPFKAEGLNMYSLFQKISQGEYQPLPTNYSEEVRNLVYAMISKEPTDRPDIAYVCSVAARMRAHTAMERSMSMSGKNRARTNSTASTDAGDDKQAKGTSSNTNSRPSSRGVGADMAATQPGQDWANAGDDEAQGHGGHRMVVEPNAQTVKPANSRTSSGRPDSAARSGRSVSNNSGNRPPHSGGGTTDRNRDRSSDRSDRTRRGVHSSEKEDSGRPTKEQTERSGVKSRENQRDREEYDTGDANGYSQHRQASNNSAGSAERSGNRTNGGRNKDTTGRSNGNTLRSHSPGTVEKTSNRIDKLSSLSYAMTLMEILYAKLMMLDIPGFFTCRNQIMGQTPSLNTISVSQFDFVCDRSLLGFGSNANTHGDNVFIKFVLLCQWLCAELSTLNGMTPIQLDYEREQPIVLTKQILIACQTMGVASSTLHDISPSALVTGHGEKVCILLGGLADCLLQKRQKAGCPVCVYGTAPSPEEEDEEPEEMEEDPINESMADVKQRDDLDMGMDAGESADLGRDTLDEYGSISMILGGVDGDMWKVETDRVTPQLLASMKQSRTRSGDTWQDHCRSITEYCGTYCLPIPSSTGTAASASLLSTSNEMVDMTASVSAISRETHEHVENIRKSESMVHTQSQMKDLSKSYSEYQEGVRVCEKLLQERGSVVDGKSHKLTVVEEQFEDAAEALRVQAAEKDGAGAGQTIKVAIRDLKEELSNMTMKEGMLSVELLTQRRLATQAHQRRTRKKHSRTRGTGKLSNGLNGKNTHDMDEMLSDDGG